MGGRTRFPIPPRQISRHDACQLTPDQNRAVDRNGSRRGLRQRGHVQHLVFLQPMQFFHKFLLHQRYNDKSAAKGSCTDIEQWT